MKEHNVKGICYFKPLRHLKFININTEFRQECMKQLEYDCLICKDRDIYIIPPEELMFVRYKNIHLDSYFGRIKKDSITDI